MLPPKGRVGRFAAAGFGQGEDGAFARFRSTDRIQRTGYLFVECALLRKPAPHLGVVLALGERFVEKWVVGVFAAGTVGAEDFFGGLIIHGGTPF